MPKIKKKAAPRKKIRKKTKTKGESILLYVFVGLIAGALIWWLSSGMDKTTHDTQYAEESPTEVKPIIKAKSKAKPESPETKDLKVSEPEVANDELDTAIASAITKLSIPEKAWRRRAKGKTITYQIPIDRAVMDLSFANMIVKGEAERQKGKLTSGMEKGGRQILNFAPQTGDKSYVVELYYDRKIYVGKTPSRAISIVVDDFGDISGPLLAKWLAIDKEVCFAIFPDAPHSVYTMQKAAEQGREVLIHVPMEPLNYPATNPGKNAILVTMNEAEIERRMKKFIADMPLASGVNNHMGSLATTDETVMQAVMKSLRNAGLYFLDSRTSNVSVAYQVAQKAHIPAFRNDIFLDSPNLSNSTFDSKLDQVIELGNKKSQVVAITHCFSEEHLEYLKRFIRKLKDAGFSIVPLSRLGNHDIPPIL